MGSSDIGFEKMGKVEFISRWIGFPNELYVAQAIVLLLSEGRWPECLLGTAEDSIGI